MNRSLKRSIRRILTPPVAGLAILAIAGPVHAGGGFAYSTIQISNFFATDAAEGGAPITLGDFQSIDSGDTVTAAPNLDGTGISASRTRDLTEDGFDSQTADVPLQCQGSDCGSIGENDFARQNVTGDGSPGYFARADGILEGSFIDIEGLDNAQSRLMSEVQLNQTGAGETDSRVTTDADFTFMTERDFENGIAFTFDAFAERYVELFQDGILARAGFSFSVQIEDANGNLVLDYRPNELNRSSSTSSAGVRSPDAVSDSFSATTDSLVADTQYTMNIVNNSNADLRVEVPEPGSVALVGLGLLLLGGTHYHRRRDQPHSREEVAIAA